MPRTPGGLGPRALNPALGRNQACGRCRLKKLKCDALSPCGSCVRSHAYAVKHNTASQSEPIECIYEDPEESTGAHRIKQLEARITELQEIIEKNEARLAKCTCGATDADTVTPGLTVVPHSDESADIRVGMLAPSAFVQDGVWMTAPLAADSTPLPISDITTLPPTMALDPTLTITPASMQLDSFQSSPMIPETQLTITSFSTQDQDQPSPAFNFDPLRSSVLDISWPLNIPPPDVLHHLSETFFASVPLATRLIHKPSFMANLQLPPTDADFPSVSLLHAISGIASLYTPIIRDKSPDLATHIGATKVFHSGLFSHGKGRGWKPGPRYVPLKMSDIVADAEVGFGAAHIRWAASSIRYAAYYGDRLLQLMQASIICAWYNYSMGLHLNLFTWIGVVNRTILPLGLNVGAGFEPLSRLPPEMTMLYPVQSWKGELPRNLYWLAFTMERIYTSPTVWPLISSENDSSQPLPCRVADFISQVYIPTEGRQRLASPSLFTEHPGMTTDAFGLYIKGAVLLGRVKTFNVRFRLKYTMRDGTDVRTSVDPKGTAEFHMLDHSIMAFIENMPKDLKDPFNYQDGGKLDPVLYMAHLLPHTATILLHDPHAVVTDPEDLSAKRMLNAARSTFDLIYKLCATSYDLLYLDHSCSIPWFIASAAIIRFLKVALDTGNAAEATRMRQEFDVVRFMLENLGQRAAVGMRQVMLLDDMLAVELGEEVPPRPQKPYNMARHDIIIPLDLAGHDAAKPHQATADGPFSLA